jgi:phosphoglycolate phosphatase
VKRIKNRTIGRVTSLVLFMIDAIIWDWNGTLLNDTDICLESMNYMLKSRNHEVLTKERYREIFNFPVQDYYRKAGFNFNLESFDVVALEFMDLYFESLPKAPIFRDASTVLQAFQQMKLNQILISAMEHESLISSVKEKGLFPYFNHISGIRDHFAAGKTENAKRVVKEKNLDSATTLLIGDTIHDFEVAKELGVRCILVANGHQSIERLKKLDCAVVESLEMILERIKPLTCVVI